MVITRWLIGKKNTVLNKKQEQVNNDGVNMDFDRNSNDLFGRYILGNENLLKGNINNEDEEIEETNDNFLNNEYITNEEEDDDEEYEGDDTDEIPLNEVK